MIAFFGGSCTVQEVLTAGHEAPSRDVVEKALSAQVANAPEVAESLEALVDASHAFVVAQADVSWRFRPFVMGFGVLLIIAYSFTSVFAMRALAFAPGAAKPLATVALLVLPARVAFSDSKREGRRRSRASRRAAARTRQGLDDNAKIKNGPLICAPPVPAWVIHSLSAGSRPRQPQA